MNERTKRPEVDEARAAEARARQAAADVEAAADLEPELFEPDDLNDCLDWEYRPCAE